eukprot:2491968-Rhodomonas_salina.1
MPPYPESHTRSVAPDMVKREHRTRADLTALVATGIAWVRMTVRSVPSGSRIRFVSLQNVVARAEEHEGTPSKTSCIGLQPPDATSVPDIVCGGKWQADLKIQNTLIGFLSSG